METNEYRGKSEPFNVPYAGNDTVDRADQRLELDRTVQNPVFRVRSSPKPTVTAAIANHRTLPLRTLIVCFTIWLIATQAMIFDEVKFETRVRLLEQDARSLGGFHMVLPNEGPPNPSTDANVQTL